jgi:hypothetical protein
MATLEGQSIASSYEQLLHVDRDGGGNTTNLVDVKDGKNTTTFALKLATDKVHVNGSLGIGVTDPAKALEIAGSGAEAELIYLTSTQSANTSNRVRQSHRLLTDSQERTSFSLLSGFNTITDGSRNSIVEFKTSNAGTFGTVMTIDGGNVGIGSSPNSFVYFYKDISNQSTWHTDSNSHLVISNPSSTSGTSAILKLAGKQGRITYGLNADTDSLTFTSRQSASSTAEVVHFDNNANVGIGTTSPNAKVDIHGDTGTWGGMAKIFLTDVNSNSSSRNWSVGNGGTAYGALSFIVSNAADGVPADSTGTAVMSLDSNSRISLSNNDGGANNTTIFGYLAGNNSGSGATQNCYIGHESGKANVYGDDNVLIGFQSGLALGASSGSVQNSLVGSLSGSVITDGDYNTFLGYRTGSTGTNDITTGTFNTFIGKGVAGSSASATNQTAIGADVTAQGDNSVTLGNADVTDVYMSSDSQAYVHSQNVPNHVANTMSSPYYRFDGVNDEIAIADSDILSFGDGSSDLPFSISAWIYMEDATNFKLISKGVYGSTLEYILNVSSDDKLKLEIYNGTNFEVASTSSTLTAYEGQWIHVASTYNGVGGASANAGMTLYINGVSQALTLSDSGTYTAMPNQSSEVRILNYADSIYGRGSVSCLRVWNKELTATEVKDDYSGASVPFKYKGASQTSLVTGSASDFSADDYYSKDTGITVTSGVARWSSAGNNTALYKASLLTIGKAYNITFTVSGYSAGGVKISIGNSGTTRSANGTFTETVVATSDTFQLMSVGTTTLDIDNLFIRPAGAVAEYMGSSAGEKVWGDSSGNDLHATVSGATLENTPYDSGTEYEEGTWSPVYKPSSNSFTTMTMDIISATYTKIGRQVTVRGSIRTDNVSVGSASGTLRLGGLPYNSVATDGESVLVVGHAYNWVSSNFPAAGYTISDSDEVLFVQRDTSNGATASMVVGDLTAGASSDQNGLIFSLTYFTA